ncbi:aldo/keto reductase [Aestuariicella hydrocarbonica]|uniref:Aldo/keto reductase n=1 Tax=Pseudomaricurvus hydrocarbonicus TaxID=1470433 RepID=A0A9E5JS15_9GAMM|nr:aldo/keto reductase [Aestuariicella hydrocarbonica]NHO65688.1 aldo/keto reductase [Aestuariicella hydrocarbonica]
MHKRNVGNSGLKVSSIGLGCNNFGLTLDASASQAIIQRALDLGVTLFDTAPVYGQEWGLSETILGQALGARRQQAVIVSKFGMTPDFTVRDSSRRGIIQGLEDSLRRLNTDYIDLYMLHWPDASTPMEETLRALDDIIRSGKARYIGCCNLPAWQVVEAKWLSKTDKLHEFIVAQDEYSLINQSAQHKLMPALEQYGMGLMPYTPLANGLLTGKYSANAAQPDGTRLSKNLWNMGDRYLTEANLQLTEKLTAFAQERGHTLLELAIAWLLAQPAVCSVIAGTTKLEQLEMNIAASDWQLSQIDLQQIEALCSESP